MISKKMFCVDCGKEVFFTDYRCLIYRYSNCGVLSGHRVRRVTYFNGEEI